MCKYIKTKNEGVTYKYIFEEAAKTNSFISFKHDRVNSKTHLGRLTISNNNCYLMYYDSKGKYACITYPIYHIKNVIILTDVKECDKLKFPLKN